MSGNLEKSPQEQYQIFWRYTDISYVPVRHVYFRGGTSKDWYEPMLSSKTSSL